MIAARVAELPELYQPIYGHPALSAGCSRSCTDRLESILSVHDAFARALARPLRVLDLGCAQGFFSFELASRGAQVLGVDYLPENIALCRALAQEHPEFAVRFEHGRIEERVESLVPGEFDLVLGLSVFHHLAHAEGAAAVVALLKKLAQCAEALLLEFALREEPLYWAHALPSDPQEWLEGIAFVHELGRFPTHLSEQARPLYVASQRFWCLGGHAAGFDHWSSESHALADGVYQGSRRYFFNAEQVCKYYHFDRPLGPVNRRDHGRAVALLSEPAAGFPAPRLIAWGKNAVRGWLIYARQPGRLLLDLLNESAPLDRPALVAQVLEQLAALEAAGLYHSDVRVWNVLVDEAGAARLIDYDAITHSVADCAWPGNVHLAFLLFVRELFVGPVQVAPTRTVALSPFGLPEPYQAWALSFWQRPLSQWSFREMAQAWRTIVIAGEAPPRAVALDGMSAWLKAVEEAVQALRDYSVHHAQRQRGQSSLTLGSPDQHDLSDASVSMTTLSQLEAQRKQLQDELERVRRELEDVHRLNHTHWMQLEAARGELAAERARVGALQAQAEAKQQQLEAQLTALRIELEDARAAVAATAADLARETGACAALEQRLFEARRKNHDIWRDSEKARWELAATREELHSVHQANHHHWTQLQAAHSELASVRAQAQAREAELVALLHSTEHALARSAADAQAQHALAEARAQQVAALHASLSWRITAPLRRGYELFGLGPRAPVSPAERARPLPVPSAPARRTLLQRLARAVQLIPGAEPLVVALLNRVPRLKVRLASALGLPIAPADLRRIGQAAQPVAPELAIAPPVPPAELGPRARALHGQLVALTRSKPVQRRG